MLSFCHEYIVFAYHRSALCLQVYQKDCVEYDMHPVSNEQLVLVKRNSAGHRRTQRTGMRIG